MFVEVFPRQKEFGPEGGRRWGFLNFRSGVIMYRIKTYVSHVINLLQALFALIAQADSMIGDTQILLVILEVHSIL